MEEPQRKYWVNHASLVYLSIHSSVLFTVSDYAFSDKDMK